MIVTNGKLPENFQDLLTAGSQNREISAKVVTLTRDRSRRIVNRDEISYDGEITNGHHPASSSAITKL